jgi:radical SAM peptide maturase (CXXX-repeat target family)/CXXX repeat peptide maturase
MTFVVTQACNLACTYCYQVGKNGQSAMSRKTAFRAVDFLLAQDSAEDSVLLSFFGGEPLLEVELIDEICDQFLERATALGHKWAHRHGFTVTTNGTLYGQPGVQRFIRKHLDRLSVSLSLDGTEARHNRSRPYPDGRGSYGDVARNVPLWRSQFPDTPAKSTFGPADLPTIRDSILHIWSLGVRSVSANLLFEDVWSGGDDEVLEDQLRELADEIVSRDLWREHNCSFFSEKIGHPWSSDFLLTTTCSAGRMLAVDSTGTLYPCVWFMPFALKRQPPYPVGDIWSGLNRDRVRPLSALTAVYRNSSDCLNCEVADGCACCVGMDYETSATGTFYERATYICRMHKARVRANEYYWARLARRKGIRRRQEITSTRQRHLFLLGASDAVSHCHYVNPAMESFPVSSVVLKQGLDLARREFYRPVILQSVRGPRLELPDTYDPLHITSSRSTSANEGDLIVFDNEYSPAPKADNVVLIVTVANLHRLNELVLALLGSAERVNTVIRGVGGMNMGDLDTYGQQLLLVAEHLLALARVGVFPEVSSITDRLYLERHEGCGAGVHALTLAPNGRLYLCPGFYYAYPSVSIGDLSGQRNDALLKLCGLGRAPLCRSCHGYHCRRCLLECWARTRHPNVPPRMMCLATNAEVKAAARLKEAMERQGTPLKVKPVVVGPADPLDELQVRGSEVVCIT